MTSNKRPKTKADLLWKVFHQFVQYRNLPLEMVVTIWNTQHREGEDLFSVFNINDQPMLRDDTLLKLYVQAFVIGLQNYDHVTIFNNYNNFINRYEKLHQLQPLSDYIHSPSWLTRKRQDNTSLAVS